MKIHFPILLLVFLTFSCSNRQESAERAKEILQLKSIIDSLELTKEIHDMNGQIATFLTFQKGDAEQAMNFYVNLFENSKIENLQRWGKEGPGKEGSIMHATFSLNGNLYMCSDSPAIHDWGFTPAISNFIECKDENEIDSLFMKLSENGKEMMPLNNYGFSKKFA